jgi:predicted transcriptional regulator of viral defense system
MSVSRVSGRSPDQEAVNAIAARQHGVITRSQLARAGFSAGMIARRLRTKQLRALHRAVYLMGPLMAAHARAMAAILACRGRAVLSHWSAAFLWGLLGLREPAWVDVSITGADHRLAGVRVHRTSAIPANEVTRRERIPVTTVARTLLDLAGVAQGRELERALEEALAKRLTSRAALNAMLERHARGRGSARLRALLEGMEPAFTRSEVNANSSRSCVRFGCRSRTRMSR